MTDTVPADRLSQALVRATGDPGWRTVDVELVAGGKSNLTYVLRSPAGELVLRRPPTGALLPSAHDMAREWRVQQALADTPVPVPAIVLTDTGDLLGAPCYVMERVAGHVVRADLPAPFADPAGCEALSAAFVDALAAVLALDPADVGLEDFGRPAGFAARQVRRWTEQWRSSRTHDVAEIDELGRRLATSVPDRGRTSLVHGDYRLDNVVYAEDDASDVRAVLDWELSTLGDPLADLGMLMLFWAGPEDPPLSLIPGVTHLPGFPDRDGVVSRYAAASGTDLDDLPFYRAFAHFKLAVIVQGVSARSRAGAMGGQDFGDLDDEILQLGRSGLELV